MIFATLKMKIQDNRSYALRVGLSCIRGENSWFSYMKSKMETACGFG